MRENDDIPMLFTEYQGALDWLYGTQMFGIKLGLEPTRQLVSAAEAWPAPGVTVFHVAGTNGKGSVCAMLDALCRAQGLRTGLFTSPHLVEFTERFNVDGVQITREEVTRLLAQIRERVRTWEEHPTFFELITALGLEHFHREQVQAIVLETGMGGRLDATNVVTPAVSIITRIDLDHQKWLGESLADIAGEKAGIIKPGVPVITVPQAEEALEVLQRAARRAHAPLTVVEEPWTDGPVGLAGSHQPLHAAVALEAMRQAGLPPDPTVAAGALADLRLDGRFQLLNASGQPATSSAEAQFILDGAHNAAAAKRLVRTWQEVFGEERPAVIYGALGDKDAESMLRALSQISDVMVPAPVRSQRARSLTEVALLIQRYAPGTLAPDAVWTGAEGFAETLAALQDHLAAAGEWPQRILITGSLFLVGEALAQLTGSGQSRPRSSSQ